MQIEQVIGGVDGDASAQAIQLRMRLGFQNGVNGARLRAHDAAGSGTILLIQFDRNVTNEGTGVRILIGSESFAEATDPPADLDFVLTNMIPESYLAAGSITFESGSGIIYWRLSWGGDAYTGPTDGATSNDSDGEFGPPYDGPLPSIDAMALQFQGKAGDQSTNNRDDYELTKGAAVFVNNDGDSFQVVSSPGCVRDPDWVCDGDVDGDSQVNPVDSGLVQAAFGSTEESDLCQYDVDCDGQINPVDSGIVQSLFGTCEAPRSVCP